MADTGKKDQPGEEKSSGGKGAKIMAAVFGAIVAPVVVAVVVKWADPSLWRGQGAPPTQPANPPPPPVAGGTPPAGQPNPTPSPTPSSPVVPSSNPPVTLPTQSAGPIRPDSVINLITPKLGDYFYTYRATNPGGVRDDNVEGGTFSYDALSGTLRGANSTRVALITKREYADYALTYEYRWGTQRDKDVPRASNLLVHGAGADGSNGREGMSAFSLILTEGDCGNMDVRGGPDLLRATIRARELVKGTPPNPRLEYDPEGPPTDVTTDGKKSTPLPAFKEHHLYHPNSPAGYKRAFGTHPPGDPSRPGEWNTVVVTCRGATLGVRINGLEMMTLTGLNRTAGKILLTVYSGDVSVRRFELAPAPPG